ncbi:PhoH family protein [bacterium]|nr:PhoH family protein [bacterium]
MSTTTNQPLTKTLATGGPDQVRILLGVRDANLRLLQQAFPVRIVAREGKLSVTGEADDVEKASAVIERLLAQVKRKKTLTDRDVAEALRAAADRAAAFTEETEAPRAPAAPSAVRSGFPISPRSRGQARYLSAIDENDLVFCAGPAGSGKTYLAVAMALHALKTERVRKIVLVRPAVEAGEKLGFLPGDMLAKVNPFLRPLLDALRDMLDFEQVQRYMEHDVIEIVPLAFMRGRTLNETFMILDEAQNTTVTQMKMFLTRMGTDSKIVVTGDETQNDLPVSVTSGLNDAMKRLKNVPGTACVNLDGNDIVRHRLVREIVKAYDDRPHSVEK